MNWKTFSDAIKQGAIKKAADQTKIQRTAALMQKYSLLAAKQASETPVLLPSTSAIRSLRRKMMAAKNASDGLTPLERVKRLLDAKIAADPKLRILGLCGQRDARKLAACCCEQPARTRKLETAAPKNVVPEKPLEGEQPASKTVTFSDGRTVTFPAKDTTPVKSASELLDGIKKKLQGK